MGSHSGAPGGPSTTCPGERDGTRYGRANERGVRRVYRRGPIDGPEEIAEVRAFWRELGVPGVIDVHTHFMPKSVMDKVWGYFDSAGPMIGRPWPIAYRLAEEERVHRLREFGVRAFTSMIYPHKHAMAEWLNQWAVEFAAQTPIACTQPRSIPRSRRRRTSARHWSRARESSSPTSRSETTIRTTLCSTRSGGNSRTPRRPS